MFRPFPYDFEDAVFAGDFFCFAEFGEFGGGEFHSAAAGFGERFEEAGGEIFGGGEGRERAGDGFSAVGFFEDEGLAFSSREEVDVGSFFHGREE